MLNKETMNKVNAIVEQCEMLVYAISQVRPTIIRENNRMADTLADMGANLMELENDENVLEYIYAQASVDYEEFSNQCDGMEYLVNDLNKLYSFVDNYGAMVRACVVEYDLDK